MKRVSDLTGDSEKKISSVSEWKLAKSKTRFITLPSECVIEVRKELGLLECATTGYIPLSLLNSVFDTGTKMADGKSFSKTTEKELSDMLDVLRKVSIIAVVNPKVSEKPVDDEMNVRDISENDLFFIFSSVLFQREEAPPNLKPFPTE